MTVQASIKVSIGVELGASFKGSFASAQGQLSLLGQAIKATSDKAGRIEAFRRSRRALDDSSVAYKAARQRVAELSAAVAKTDKPSKELQNNLRKAQKELDRARKGFVDSGRTARQMGATLKEAGIDVNNLNRQSAKLGATLETLRKRQAALRNIEDAKAANMAARAGYRAQMMDAVALGTALYSVVKPSVSFELAMAKVGAITNEAAEGEGFAKLTAQARELGRTTQYTASQAAEAMQYLGMAGFNTQQILAATPAALNLAIAGNMDLGRTADIASNILTGFNIKAEETARVADVLAQTARSTNVNVEMLGDTMKYVAPAAAAVGASLEDTAALAGVLGDAGIQGTMSGTMLRAAYLRLAAPANKGAEALERLGSAMGLATEEMPDVAKEAALAQAHLGKMGVTVFDDQGKMRSMVDILRDMSAALKEASDQDKLATVKAIFGERSSAGALAIFKHVETGRLDEVLAKTHNAQGVADEMAARMKNTAHGAFKEFTSAVESVGISLGAVLLPAFASLARGAASVANKIGTFADKFPTLTKYIGLAVTGLISAKIAGIALGYGFTFLTGGFLNILGLFTKVRTGLTLLRLGMLSTRALAIANGFAAFGRSLLSVASSAIPAVIGGVKAMTLALMANPIGLAIAAIAAGAALIIYYWEPIKTFFGKLWHGIKAGAQSVWDAVAKVVEPIKKVKDMVGSAWNWLFGGKDDKAKPANGNRKVGSAVKTFAGRDVDAMNIQARKAVNRQTTNSSTVNTSITVNAAPGMDERKVAAEVQKALRESERRAKTRKRAANYD